MDKTNEQAAADKRKHNNSSIYLFVASIMQRKTANKYMNVVFKNNIFFRRLNGDYQH